jgi:hypothetical protein
VKATHAEVEYGLVRVVADDGRVFHFAIREAGHVVAAVQVHPSWICTSDGHSVQVAVGRRAQPVPAVEVLRCPHAP